jgi:hypothetical protein
MKMGIAHGTIVMKIGRHCNPARASPEPILLRPGARLTLDTWKSTISEIQIMRMIF